MVYVNEFDKGGESIKDGTRAENNFERLFEGRFGVKPIKATVEENKYKHIDYWMELPSSNRIHRASVDVKSWKHDPDNVWVEFVSYGRLGWLYGEADFIGFELPDMTGFIMVRRKGLVDFVSRNCRVFFTRDKDKAMYNLYVRWKGEDSEIYDCVTLIPRERLYEIDYWLLK